eukprot:XP_027303233.1 evolutionarily conserved signaling intermediate in Toll pathway, mitochondrial [Anas platyrhynchos]
MLYWLPRLRHADPHPLPPRLPPPGLAAARLGLRRIANDPDAQLTVYQPPHPASGADEGSQQPYIIGSQSEEQRELLARHGPERPVFVEGPFPLWLRSTRLEYYVLRGDPLPPHLRVSPPPISLTPPQQLRTPPGPRTQPLYPLYLDLDLERGPWDDENFDVDEEEEGPVFALCMAGAGDQRTLAKWLAGLQETNPVLGRTPVLFRLGGGTAAAPPQPPDPPPPPGRAPAPPARPPRAGSPPGAAGRGLRGPGGGSWGGRPLPAAPG